MPFFGLMRSRLNRGTEGAPSAFGCSDSNTEQSGRFYRDTTGDIDEPRSMITVNAS